MYSLIPEIWLAITVVLDIRLVHLCTLGVTRALNIALTSTVVRFAGVCRPRRPLRWYERGHLHLTVRLLELCSYRVNLTMHAASSSPVNRLAGVC